jgi:hypothetical protein
MNHRIVKTDNGRKSLRIFKIKMAIFLQTNGRRILIDDEKKMLFPVMSRRN